MLFNPLKALRPAGRYAYSEFFQAQQVGYGATIATALTVVIAIVSILFIRAQNAAERKERAGL